MRTFIKLLALLVLLMHGAPSTAQDNLRDTLALSIQETEQLFLKNNLLLLASKYNIEANRAEILQNKLWNNPSLSLEQNIYNKYTGRAFDVTQTGQSIVHVEQLFLLAGKRNKKINLSEINTQIAEYQFYDLLRSLKFELRSVYFNIHYLLKTVALYDEEINSLQKTLTIFDILIQKGAIAKKEVIRIKALQFTLESERLAILKEIYTYQAEINTLLNNTPHKFVKPVINDHMFDSLDIKIPSLQALYDTAMVRRMDLKIAESTIKYHEANIAYQKSLRVPDIQAGYLYDRAGSYIPNYNALTVQIDLPFFNRNQGNIAIAKHRRDEGVTMLAQQKQVITGELNEAYQTFKETHQTFISHDQILSTDFDELIDIIQKNYEKRNISLIEFVDYYQAYKTSMVQLFEVKNQRIQALEQLNFYTGKDIIEY